MLVGTLRCREALGCLQPPLLPSIACKARSRPPQGFPVAPLCGVALWELAHGRSTPGGPPRSLQPEVMLSRPRRISALPRQAGEGTARGGARSVCACACACACVCARARAAAAPAALQSYCVRTPWRKDAFRTHCSNPFYTARASAHPTPSVPPRRCREALPAPCPLPPVI